MARLLRTINKSKWYEERPQWLGPDEIHADPLTDLKTEANELSVWLVEDDGISLERLLAAIAANRSTVDKLDFALFDPADLVPYAIKIEETEGRLPDSSISGWHRNLIELSDRKLVALTKVILDRAQRDRRLPRAVEALIRKALTEGWIKRDSLSPKIREKLDA